VVLTRFDLHADTCMIPALEERRKDASPEGVSRSLLVQPVRVWFSFGPRMRMFQSCQCNLYALFSTCILYKAFNSPRSSSIWVVANTRHYVCFNQKAGWASSLYYSYFAISSAVSRPGPPSLVLDGNSDLNTLEFKSRGRCIDNVSLGHPHTINRNDIRVHALHELRLLGIS
jgi:hypothetical protein